MNTPETTIGFKKCCFFMLIRYQNHTYTATNVNTTYINTENLQDASLNTGYNKKLFLSAIKKEMRNDHKAHMVIPHILQGSRLMISIIVLQT